MVLNPALHPLYLLQFLLDFVEEVHRPRIVKHFHRRRQRQNQLVVLILVLLGPQVKVLVLHVEETQLLELVKLPAKLPQLGNTDREIFVVPDIDVDHVCVVKRGKVQVQLIHIIGLEIDCLHVWHIS